VNVMAGPSIYPVVDEGLGNSSYLVDLGDRRALVIDPTRDPSLYSEMAERLGLQIAYAAETHLHADFVSGSRELAAHGATVFGSTLGGREFPHRGVGDGDEIELGGLTLRAIATPGHTQEHLAYLLLDGGRPVALFSGGSLLVGAVARTDLVSPDRTEELARAMYRSLHERLLALPEDLAVYPTHGAGSFCAAPAGAERVTTIGRERAVNPLLAAPDVEAFVQQLVGGLGTYPTYFLRLQQLNRRGPRVYGTIPDLPSLTADDVKQLASDGAEVVDVRPVAEFGAGHIPGALSIALRPAFATWLGWLVRPNKPVVFVLGDGQDRGDVVRQALKIGYEQLAGELTGGTAAWRAAGYEERGVALVSRPPDTPLIDVRQAAEYRAGHIAGAISIELGSLSEPRDLPPGPLTVTCAHQERAMSGASLLERNGRSELAVLEGGMSQWAALASNHLTVGS
jgi:hydroxyacylglutathione hydrolase